MQFLGNNSAENFVSGLVTDIQSETVREWARTVLLRHVRKTVELCKPLVEADICHLIADDGLSPEAESKIFQAFHRGEQFYGIDIDSLVLHEFADKCRSVFDYMHSLGPDDRHIRRIDRLSWSSAVELSDRWHHLLAKRADDTAAVETSGVKRHVFEDGAYVVELCNQSELSGEGRAMGHCVGSYYNKVKAGTCRIFSLRDVAGKPHVTIEVVPSVKVDRGHLPAVYAAGIKLGVNRNVAIGSEFYAVQVRGKQNAAPVERYRRLVDKWFDSERIVDTHAVVSTQNERLPEVYAVGTSIGKATITTDLDTALSALSSGLEDLLKQGDNKKIQFFWDQCKGSKLVGFLNPNETAEKIFRLMRSVFARLLEGQPVEYSEELWNSYMRPFWQVARERSVQKISGSDAIFWENLSSSIEADLLSLSDSTGVSCKSGRIAKLANGVSYCVNVHCIPGIEVAMLAVGPQTGANDNVLFDRLNRQISDVLENIEKDPANHHIIVTAWKRSAEKDLLPVIYACGLGQRYEAVKALVSAKSSDALRAMSRLSVGERSEENRNFVRNFASASYSSVIAEFTPRNYRYDGVLQLGPKGFGAKPSEANVVKDHEGKRVIAVSGRRRSAY